jgi:hypothetical protein
VKKSDDYYRVWPARIDITSTWNVTDIPVHARKRRVLNHAFSERALRSAEPYVHSNVDRWLDLFEERGKGGKKSFNMAHEINYLVFDILGDLCFGKSFEMKEPGSKVTEIPEILAEFLTFMNPVSLTSSKKLTNTDEPDLLLSIRFTVGLAEAKRSRLASPEDSSTNPQEMGKLRGQLPCCPD